MNTNYNSEVSSYNTKVGAFNKAVTDEKNRKADFFKAIFEKEVTVPERPGPKPFRPPTSPNPVAGVKFFATSADEQAWFAGTGGPVRGIMAYDWGIAASS